MVRESRRPSPLVAIKLLHTLVWAFFAGCILAIPISGALGDYKAAVICFAITLGECLILAANRGRCPLTDIAARHTAERADNFDIYLPLWLARYNKLVFGTIYVLGALFAFVRWLHH